MVLPGKPGRGSRKSTHIVDPVVPRTCKFCGRVHAWPLSRTQDGAVIPCQCGATFSSFRFPQWVFAPDEARAARKARRPRT